MTETPLEFYSSRDIDHLDIYNSITICRYAAMPPLLQKPQNF